MSITISGIVANGVVVPSSPLPEGASVDIHVHEAAPDREAWLRFVEKITGSITDPTFERHPQGEFEERDSLS
jgi:hypothetical protein